jgi:hypothetical protein
MRCFGKRECTNQPGILSVLRSNEIVNLIASN